MANKSLQPLRVDVTRHEFGKPNHVALHAESEQGQLIWIVDETVFKSEGFFLPFTPENIEKLEKSKAAVERQKARGF